MSIEALGGISLILFDMEVYKYDWIAGFKIHNTGEYVQIHNDTEALKEFLAEYKEAFFFTINGERYDNNILDGILKGKDPYAISQLIIKHNMELYAWRLPVTLYDLSKQKTFYPSLKAFESNNGMAIEETNVDFDIDRPLTPEELELNNIYNRHDLDATELSMIQRMPESIMVKARLIKYFGLDIKKWISRTSVSIVTTGLGAKKGKFPHQKFTFDGIYSVIDIENEKVKEHLRTENFYNEDLTIEIAGITHEIKQGGIHAARDGFYESDDCWHADFGSFYPSIMIEFDLLSRALTLEEGLPKFLQLRKDRYVAKANKSLDDIALKEGINSVFGAANSVYSNLYDPSRSTLVCMYGQAFAIDLTEKLIPYVTMIQSNTDGLIFSLKKDVDDAEFHMRRIIGEFTDRTGLTMDIEHYKNLRQKDVNNYVAIHEGKIQSKGGMTNMWDLHPDFAHYRGTYRLFQQTVIDRAVTFSLLYGRDIEDTVQEQYDLKNWFRFQSTSKAGKMYHRIGVVEEHHDYLKDVVEMNKLIKNKDIKKILRGTSARKVPDKGFNIRIKDYPDFINQYEDDNFDDTQLEVLDMLDIRPIINQGKVEDVQHTNRVFASNDKTMFRTLYKYKWANVKKDGKATGEKKLSKSVISNLPANVFVYNLDMADFTEDLQKQIDLDYYIDMAYTKTAFYRDREIKKDKEFLKLSGQELRNYVVERNLVKIETKIQNSLLFT